MKQTLAAVLLAAGCVAAQAPSQAAQTPEPLARFHHLHLNATDPKVAIEFYTSRFDSEKGKFAGRLDAVWAQKSWILFTKVAAAPPSEILSTIWHFGWGAEDMPKEYQRQLDLGTKFQTPITDISDIGGGNARGLFYYAYVDGPDHALIELNTARHHQFGHLHLLSADPVAAGEWYAKHFGIPNVRYGRQKRVYRNVQIGPSASMMIDNVNVIIYPLEYAQTAWPELWAERKAFESTKGRVVDHIGLSVDNLDETLARLAKDGIKAEGPMKAGNLKIAFIEGPDKMRIELVEGHAKKE